MYVCSSTCQTEHGLPKDNERIVRREPGEHHGISGNENRYPKALGVLVASRGLSCGFVRLVL